MSEELSGQSEQLASAIAFFKVESAAKTDSERKRITLLPRPRAITTVPEPAFVDPGFEEF